MKLKRYRTNTLRGVKLFCKELSYTATILRGSLAKGRVINEMVLKRIIKPFAIALINLGIDPRKAICYKFYPKFRKDKSEWLQGGKITYNYMILFDYSDNAGTSKGHYFHQDLLVAKLINEHNPKRHIDVASRVDGFVAHVASYREIEVLDACPLEKSGMKILNFVKLI